jgi:hypothetical protein
MMDDKWNIDEKFVCHLRQMVMIRRGVEEKDSVGKVGIDI